MLLAMSSPAIEAKRVETPVLINATLLNIHRALEHAKNPAVCWSAGKESQLLLTLCRRLRPDISVLHFRGFDDPQSKHSFADEQIKNLDLNVTPARPAGFDVVARGDHVEIIEAYFLQAHAALYFPIEAEPGHIPGPESHCAIEKLNQPVSDEPLGIDCVFIGHRAGDGDAVHGAMPLDAVAVHSHGVMFVYPLKDWTEANVWEASEVLNVSQNKARYERGDMAANSDYFLLCTECLKPSPHDSVVCPKFGGSVYSLGRYLDLEQRREDWRRKFINLEGDDDANA